MRKTVLFILMGVLAGLSIPAASFAFGEMAGACDKNCTACHKITNEEVGAIIKGLNPEVDVVESKLALVNGFWEVVIKGRGRKEIVFIDFAKRHVIAGTIYSVETKENLTAKRIYDLNRVDISAIPLESALLLGRLDAKHRVIVFSDPD